MGALPRLKKKDELNYRSGSTNEARNCRYCINFKADFYDFRAIGGRGPVSRCTVIGMNEGRRYDIRRDHTCDSQQFDGTDFSGGGSK
jgi:hypothetical protein